MLPTICPSEFLEGGMKDPSVYIHCCEWYLRGCMWLYAGGRGSVKLLLGGGAVLSLEVVFHALENLMWYVLGTHPNC